MRNSNASLITAIVQLPLVAACTIPAVLRTAGRFSSAKRTEFQRSPDRYEDEDGVASEESEAEFSDRLQRVAIIVFATTGFAVTLPCAVLSTLHSTSKFPTEQWLLSATWVFLTFQATTILIEPVSTKRFELGLFGGISSLFVLVTILTQNFSLWSTDMVPAPRIVYVILTSIQLAAAILNLCTNVLIPRRPNVYYNGKPVDQQYTTSLLGRYGFAWPGPLLNFAAKNRGLEISDLPEIDHEIRSENLRKRFDAVGKTDKLWKSIFFSHKRSFLMQWILVAVTSVTNFLPQLALLYILRTLEARDQGLHVATQAWMWVIALGASIIISSWLEAWLFFVVFSKIGIPVYEQLSAVVFGKAMRRKDVKGTLKKVNGPRAESEMVINKSAGAKDEDTVQMADDEEDEVMQKTRQSTINLVGVDSKRVADFATFCYLFPGTAIKLIVSFAFLAKLIGWIPLLSGMIIPVIITPINVLAARRYSKAQDELMKARDRKMALVTEALQGIRQIKFSALERQWHTKILDIRSNELDTIWRVFKCDTVLISIWIMGPVLLSAVALAVYTIINKELSASVAFTTISVFEAIEMTLAIIPEFITEYLDAIVSAGRIEQYLGSPEKEETTIPAPAISYEDASIAWPSDDAENEDDRFRLRNLNLQFPNKELSVISGKTGSGKSLLLASILGEADVEKGFVKVPRAPPPQERYDSQATQNDWYLPGSIAFVAQIPWIENASIRDNILFGLPHDSRRYRKVLHVCALEKDLDVLPDGEMTDIGANGINLSGGQRWRVSFARALYSRASILVLDDIFSAVDAHVGRHLFEEALTGELGGGRTRILVTHHVALCLTKTKYSVLLEDGTARHAGLVEDLRKNGHLKALLENDIEAQEKREAEAEEQSALYVDDGGGLRRISTNISNRSRRLSTIDNGRDTKQDLAPKKFTEDEKRETGSIKYKIYAEYVQSSGGVWYWAAIGLVFAITIGLYLGRTWWVSLWTRSYRTESRPMNHLLSQNLMHHYTSQLKNAQVSSELWYYLGVYLVLSILCCVIATSRYFMIFVASIRASKDLFEKLTYTVLRATLRWLDTVPVGRVLNRFTADFNMIDSRISLDLGFMLNNAMQVLAVVVAGIFVSPLMILFAVILLAICMRYALKYLNGAREVKRLESNAKSPVFEQFGSVLTGIGTIRAFDKVESYVYRMYKQIDRHCQASWHLWLFNRWMGFRLNMVGAVFATITAALIVSIKGIDASLAGFALSFSLEYTTSLVWALRQWASVELDMNAVERIVEYSNIKTETQSGESVPAAWPTEGRVEVSDLVVGYADDLPPVLKGLSFSIKKNQRVGVVGRTGAGKSSLTLALFRFLEAREGTVLVDGIDISTIKLHDLRSRLAIIPQDPVLFSGTVRSNLDAFNEHNDIELRDALQRVQLIDTEANSAVPSGSATPVDDGDSNLNVFRSLSSKISEGGLNLSQGQRQLLCLARAIVSRPKVMVLDEATSAVDMATDALIQRSIREEFQDSTLIVIAHRLSTIVDFDRILVMGDGKVLEYDEPERLMEIEGGEFRKMVEESGEREVLENIIRERHQGPI